MMCSVRWRVDVVDHRRQRRRLARAGRARAENQAAPLLGDLLEDRRQHQLADREDLDRDDAEDHAHRAALLEDVAAEAAQAGDRVRDVDLVVVLELFLLARGHDRERHRDRVFLHEPLQLDQRNELAVHADDRMRADLDVKVRRPALGGNFQQVIDVQGSPRGDRWFLHFYGGAKPKSL